MDTDRLSITPQQLSEFCKQAHILKFAVFGSALRDDFGPNSDIDVLVEFDPDESIGLIKLAGIERQLQKILGRKTDLNTPGFLSPHFRDEVLHQMEILYDAT